VKTLEKNYLAAVSAGKKDDASQALNAVSSALDKAAKVGVIPKPRAQRKRGRLQQRMNAIK
jgi:small subunit ribosomal protein S20